MRVNVIVVENVNPILFLNQKSYPVAVLCLPSVEVPSLYIFNRFQHISVYIKPFRRPQDLLANTQRRKPTTLVGEEEVTFLYSGWICTLKWL